MTKSWIFEEDEPLTFEKDTNYIVHTHSKQLDVLLNESITDTTLILCKRRNIFESIMSHEVALKTQEFNVYTNKEIEPFYINPYRYIELYAHRIGWFSDVDLTLPFYAVKEIYYEDILLYGETHVNDILKFNTEYNKNIALDLKSPYNYKKIVVNWRDLKDLTEHLYKFLKSAKLLDN